MAKLMVVKRNGEVVDFDQGRIVHAIKKATMSAGKQLDDKQIDLLVGGISDEIGSRFVDLHPNVENIQDIVEKHLVKKDLYEIAKEFILYRAKRQEEREQERKQNIQKSLLGKLTVKKADGRTTIFDNNKLKETLRRTAKGLEDVSVDLIAKEVVKNVYDGITTEDLLKTMILSGVSFIEKDPQYSFFAARLFRDKLFKEVTGKKQIDDGMGLIYREAFIKSIKLGVEKGVFDKRLLEFDLEKLSYGLKIDRDDVFEYIGIQTLYERYFTKSEGKRIELPQAFWMRVAMGLAMNETDKSQKVLEFYDAMSTLRYVPSTPTLFHAGLSHPQLSSCYLTTVSDDLNHIFKCLGDNAQLSKWSGGLGNDWTYLRATGARIKTTAVESQGVIPFLKVANDVTVAINRSGKRRGATCAYLETWHLDIEDFLDLRKNTGDDRRRTHDMNTSNWIPDLFMKRVLNDEPWTLFSPDETPELHDLYGRKFEKKYVEYEEKARNGKIKKHKVVSATKLWRKMLSMLFETGHPWITFKDPCNIRSPQDHAGVIHSSNLCTEITLNTSAQETAVCNLGSINLAKHIVEEKLDENLLAKTIKTAVRMLDNVIDINFYPTKEAEFSNFKHRPVGLGIMGFQDALFQLRIPFESPAALKFADNSMELIAYHAILGSSALAKERGTYESYSGSKWDRGIFPQDTIELLSQERDVPVEVSGEETLDWTPVREAVRQSGMRNSNIMAIAPTATISNIAGCAPCIEPIYKNIYVKANMSGEFTIVNRYLVQELKQRKLWNQEMLEQLKYHDGNVSMIAAIPEELRKLYVEAFDVDAEWAIKMTAARGKWIDQSQSHNVFLKGVSGSKLSAVYFAAWKQGLKTTYYLRSMAASQVEKSTLDANKFGFTQKREYSSKEEPKIQAPKVVPVIAPASEVKNACSIMDPDCEACQ